MPIQYATSDVHRMANREGLSAVEQQNMVPDTISVAESLRGVNDRVKRDSVKKLWAFLKNFLEGIFYIR